MDTTKQWTAEEIAAMMVEYDLTNQALAKLCGVHWTTVSRWRNGQNRPEGMANKLLSMVEEQLRSEKEPAKKGRAK